METTIISSQRYLDDAIVAAKLAAGEFVVTLSPVFTVDGVSYRTIIDGHHRLEAATLANVTPTYVEATVAEYDAINLLTRDEVDAFLTATWVDSDYYDVATGDPIW